jgi:uncharacterized protein (TIGR00252 family)
MHIGGFFGTLYAEYMNTTKIGNAAEQLVADYMISKGCELLSQNWRTKYCEVDLIMQKNNIVYFVEVKYRSNTTTGDGLEYVDRRKIQRLVRATSLWRLTNKHKGQCDILAASVSGIPPQLKYLVSIAPDT